jgi:hypothetical protein
MHAVRPGEKGGGACYKNQQLKNSDDALPQIIRVRFSLGNDAGARPGEE